MSFNVVFELLAASVAMSLTHRDWFKHVLLMLKLI